MEEFNSQMSGNLDSGCGCDFLYGNPADAPMSSSFYLQPLSGDRFDGSDGQQLPIVKAEAEGTSQNHGCAIHWRRETDTVDAMKARIVDHPQYSNLLDAYMNCQKVSYRFSQIKSFKNPYKGGIRFPLSFNAPAAHLFNLIIGGSTAGGGGAADRGPAGARITATIHGGNRRRTKGSRT